MKRKIRELQISDRNSVKTYEIKIAETPDDFPSTMSLGHLYVNGEFLIEIIFVKKSKIKKFLFKSNEIFICRFERCRSGGKFPEPQYASCFISFLNNSSASAYISKKGLLKIIDLIF